MECDGNICTGYRQAHIVEGLCRLLESQPSHFDIIDLQIKINNGKSDSRQIHPCHKKDDNIIIDRIILVCENYIIYRLNLDD